jgi:hypothetical protein
MPPHHHHHKQRYSDMWWDDMSEKAHEAAINLGYTAETWDEDA